MDPSPASIAAQAFGMLWLADLPLPQFDPVDVPDADLPVIRVCRVAALPDRTSLAGRGNGDVHADGFRFAWGDEVVFDMWHGTRIDYLPGPGWTGQMPVAFYGTVAALTAAWCGALPCHASAVEVAGRAVLIAGVAGAGKSTLTAELLLQGARLISDDLTVIAPRVGDAPFRVYRGRPTIRLHADTAVRIPALSSAPVPGDDRGKWLVRPIARAAPPDYPLAGFVLLGAPDGPVVGPSRAVLLAQLLFRPHWLRLLPGQQDRLRTVFALASAIPCHGLARGAFHADADAVAAARRVIDTMVA